MIDKVDLNAPPENHTVKVSVQPDEKSGDVWVRNIKDLVLFFVAIAFVGVILWLCLEAIRSTTSSQDEKRWAQSVLSAATGGIIGYLVRK